MKKIENLIALAIESTVTKTNNLDKYFENITRFFTEKYEDECNIYQVVGLHTSERYLYVTDFCPSHYGKVNETMLEITIYGDNRIKVCFVRDIPEEYEDEREYVINYIVWNENTKIIYNMSRKVYQVFELDNNLISETLTIDDALQVCHL